ncbi:hypothetical protein LCGC14_1038880 [marine sediment metagenome]|uniref:GIY-YIG domain-containing protein n=1 Tax=marine sediment metagenome TaxID=412755 RepID=A0A0F9QAK7_9ZZZZ
MSRIIYIYRAVHTPTNTAYVGSALDPWKRWQKHVEGIGAECTSKWIQSMNELPIFRVVDTCDEGDRQLVESAWIVHYGTKLRYEMINGTWSVYFTGLQAKAGGHAAQEILRRDGKGLYNPEIQLKGARMGGRAAQATLHRKRLTIYDPEIQLRGARNGGLKGGHIGGRNQPIEVKRENGRKAQATHKLRGTGWYNSALQSKLSLKGTHSRWHVARGIINADCELCETIRVR